MYREHLISTGIDENNIIMMNFTHDPFSNMSMDEIASIVMSRTERMYILFDEVQMVQSWDRMILHLFENADCDICITGSNSVMFSSNLSTILSGRVVSMELFPFSYMEFLEFTEQNDSDGASSEYMTYGGFPLALMVRNSREAETAVLEDIYNTVILKDIALRYSIRNQQMLDRISRYLIRNIGSLVSVKGIRDFMASNGFKVNFETIDGYLGYLEESLAFHRVKRFNIKTKEELVVNDKFYLSDLGIRTAIIGKRDVDTGHLMENLVYLELKRRGFDVHIGTINGMEVDFVIMNHETKAYVQVCYTLKDPATEERELRPLRSIRDGYRKVIITMEKSFNEDRDGIVEMGLREFLSGRCI